MTVNMLTTASFLLITSVYVRTMSAQVEPHEVSPSLYLSPSMPLVSSLSVSLSLSLSLFVSVDVVRRACRWTGGFLIHGRHARILARVFGVRSEDQGGAEEKYSFTVPILS